MWHVGGNPTDGPFDVKWREGPPVGWPGKVAAECEAHGTREHVVHGEENTVDKQLARNEPTATVDLGVLVPCLENPRGHRHIVRDMYTHSPGDMSGTHALDHARQATVITGNAFSFASAAPCTPSINHKPWSSRMRILLQMLGWVPPSVGPGVGCEFRSQPVWHHWTTEERVNHRLGVGCHCGFSAFHSGSPTMR